MNMQAEMLPLAALAIWLFGSGALSAWVAGIKERDPVVFFVLGLFLPVLSLLALAAIPNPEKRSLYERHPDLLFKSDAVQS